MTFLGEKCMNLTEEFQIAGDTVRGSLHISTDKPNQDAFVWRFLPDYILGIVCDGCGSGKYSEAGSKVGVRLIAKAIKENLNVFMSQPMQLFRSEPPYPFWERVRQDVLAQIRILVRAMGGSLSQTVTDYFLFTTVGFLMTPFGVSIFSIGDGVFIINGEVKTIGPFPENKPPYITYDLTGSSVTDNNPSLRFFQINEILKIDDVQSILIGCDGLEDFIGSENKVIPGGKEKDLVGPVSQFWEQDGFFTNRDMVRRRLAVVNRPYQKIVWDKKQVIRKKGLLRDDTTLIVVRRKPKEKEET